MARGKTSPEVEEFMKELHEAVWDKRAIQLCEVARSFGYKLNVGNYESRDFFCSQKVECPIEKVEEISEKLYQFCKDQVMKAVKEWKASKQ